MGGALGCSRVKCAPFTTRSAPPTAQSSRRMELDATDISVSVATNLIAPQRPSGQPKVAHVTHRSGHMRRVTGSGEGSSPWDARKLERSGFTHGKW